MKILVSTKYLPKEIDRVLRKGFTDFAITGVKNEIRFYKNEKEQITSICPTVDCEKDIFEGRVNQLQWYKISEFVKLLPEQPIVLDFEDNYDETISIKLTQFVAWF